MKRIIKYMKPYAALVLAAVLLLFGQAFCDLSLPNYMSKIVDTGIQQGGIENAVPSAVSESTMDTLLGFMDGGGQQTALENYTLITKDSVSYAAYLEDYPALADENIYVKNTAGGENDELLNPAFAKAFASVSAIVADRRGVGGRFSFPCDRWAYTGGRAGRNSAETGTASAIYGILRTGARGNGAVCRAECLSGFRRGIRRAFFPFGRKARQHGPKPAHTDGSSWCSGRNIKASAFISRRSSRIISGRTAGSCSSLRLAPPHAPSW